MSKNNNQVQGHVLAALAVLGELLSGDGAGEGGKDGRT
jgi:hypothetical protein